MENYFRAKERLFRELLDKDGTSVINLDDPYGKRLIAELGDASGRHDSEQRKILTYGLEERADIVAREIHTSSEGVKFKISFRGRMYDVSSPLMGLPNVYNIMSAAGASISLGVPWQVILDGIGKTGSVRGRFEKVDLGQNFLCIIDYAHTEDALEQLIFTARELIKDSPGSMPPRIITVFAYRHGLGNTGDPKKPSRGTWSPSDIAVRHEAQEAETGCEAAGAKKPEAHSLEYADDFFAPRTTQMARHPAPQ